MLVTKSTSRLATEGKSVDTQRTNVFVTFISTVRRDLHANRGNPKGILLTVLYRLAHACVELPIYVRPIGWIYIALYKVVTEYILGVEIHWRATIGPGLTVFHGYGLVINSAAQIGKGCVLRHGVTIGVKKTHGNVGAPTIGDNVDIGASAIIIGPISVGDECVIGAGAVVVKDLYSGSVVVGNPARVVRNKKSRKRSVSNVSFRNP